MRTVTVFGGSGFIGRHLVKRLAARGWAVRVAVRSVASANFLKLMGNVGQIQPLHADIRDLEAVARAVEGVDDVVNLVGILHQSRTQRFHALHVTGAQTIASAARKAGVAHLVHLSALGADSAAPALYAQSKALGEAAVQEAFPTSTRLRPSLVVGAEDQFFNRFGRMARFAPVLPLISPKSLFQPVAVADVADAIVAALTRSEAPGKLYELGGPEIYSLRDLMELILQVIGRRRFLLPIPLPLAFLLARVLEKLPSPLLTRDQIWMLQRDNIVTPGALGLSELGINPSAIAPLLPGFMGFLRPRQPGNGLPGGGHAPQRNRAR